MRLALVLGGAREGDVVVVVQAHVPSVERGAIGFALLVLQAQPPGKAFTTSRRDGDSCKQENMVRGEAPDDGMRPRRPKHAGVEARRRCAPVLIGQAAGCAPSVLGRANAVSPVVVRLEAASAMAAGLGSPSRRGCMNAVEGAQAGRGEGRKRDGREKSRPSTGSRRRPGKMLRASDRAATCARPGTGQAWPRTGRLCPLRSQLASPRSLRPAPCTLHVGTLARRRRLLLASIPGPWHRFTHSPYEPVLERQLIRRRPRLVCCCCCCCYFVTARCPGTHTRLVRGQGTQLPPTLQHPSLSPSLSPYAALADGPVGAVLGHATLPLVGRNGSSQPAYGLSRTAITAAQTQGAAALPW